MSNISFGLEVLTPELAVEMGVLLEENSNETSPLEEKLDVYWKGYFLAQSAGILKIYTVRSDLKLVGFAVYVVEIMLHHKTLVRAVCDTIFISKGSRKGATGMDIIKFCESQLKRIGVSVVTIGTNNKRDLSKLFKRLGYSPTETVFSRRI